MPTDILKVIDGAPVHAVGGYLRLGDVPALSGIGLSDLLRAAATNQLGLFCRLSRAAGVVIHIGDLRLHEHKQTPSGRMFKSIAPPTLPDRNNLPGDAYEYIVDGVNAILQSDELAGAILANDLTDISISLFQLGATPTAEVFWTDSPVSIPVARLEVSVSQVEAVRKRIALGVPAASLEQARATQKSEVQTTARVGGGWASRRFTEVVRDYCSMSDGLPATLADVHELRQRQNGLLLFSEFMGDLTLAEIGADTLRSFRDGPLREFPDHANRLKKAARAATMTQTVELLKATNPAYARMTPAQQQERMRWLFRMFTWLFEKERLSSNPASTVRGETGLTKAERVAAKTKSDDEEDGRRPFSDAELKLIFGQRHYQTGNGKHVTKKNQSWRPFEYWMPLLSLFAGLRLKEACQLHLADVTQVDQVWCLDINRRTSDKALKSEASTRRIPVHSCLIALGFLEYVERLRQEGYRRVFPELSFTLGPAKYAKEPGRRMSSMLKELGMPRDGTLVFHNFRHNANNGLARVPMTALPNADAKLQVFIRYRVIGHELPDDVNARHYTSVTVAEMAAVVNGLAYDLPRIERFDMDDGIGRVRTALEKKLGARKGREDMGPLNAVLEN